MLVKLSLERPADWPRQADVQLVISSALLWTVHAPMKISLNTQEAHKPDVAHLCPKCGTGMVIRATTRQLAPLEKFSLDHLAGNWWLWPVAGLIAFLYAPNKHKIEDHLFCPACGTDGPTIPVLSNQGDTPITAHRNLKALLAPDFIGSAIVAAAMIAILIGVLLSQPFTVLLKHWFEIGLLAAGILFVLRIFVFPLLREAIGPGKERRTR
ncbi:hypothetical protein F8A87_04555 [Betaproteobacteria bacterium SCN2]|jgi:hypothetical protein|nr:hypothetical protein F8A87_04555 [Betaproteobacteria bacterium SCN2]